MTELQSIEEFLPETGEIAVVGMIRNPAAGFSVSDVHHAWLDASKPDIIGYVEGAVEALAAKGCTDFYWTPASFKFDAGVPKRRNASMAKLFRCFYVDLDAHGGADDYKSPREALKHLFDVCQEIDMLPSAVMFTGRGVQAIWGFHEDLSVERWRTVADDIWAVLYHYGIKMDPACRQDRARVIRLPGTMNSVVGLQARCVYQDDIYNARKLSHRLQDFMAERGIAPPQANTTPERRGADPHGTVFSCKNNEKILEWILGTIPASFTGRKPLSGRVPLSPKSGYERWRDVVWAAKRTGLPNAWDAVYSWAQKARREYDDLDEALTRTWDSDNAGAANAIGPGTLIMIAREFAAKKYQATLRVIHFTSYASAVSRGEAEPPEMNDWWGDQMVYDWGVQEYENG